MDPHRAPASGESMADWDWQPSVNRPLRRQGAVASVRQDLDEKRDILALPNRPVGSPVSQKGSLPWLGSMLRESPN